MADGINPPESAPDIFLKCCETTKIKIVVCVACGSAYHKSCYGKSINIGDTRVSKCNECAKGHREGKRLTPTPSSSANPLELELLRKENECLKREMELLKQSVSNLEEIVKLQKEFIQHQENQPVASSLTPAITSYSSALKTRPTIATVFIKSGDQSNIQVEEQIKENIDPASFQIRETKLIKNGILIRCEESNADRLKKHLVEKIGYRYSVSEPAKLNPRIRVFDVDETTAKSDDLISNIIKANDLACDITGLKLVTTLKSNQAKNSSFVVVNVILEVVPDVFKYIMKSGTLYVGWRRCKVKEHLNLLKCFKCCKIGHTAKNCSNRNFVCGKCSGSHDTRSCDSDILSCINCKNYNTKSQNPVPYDHSANEAQKCSYYNYHLELLKKKILS